MSVGSMHHPKGNPRERMCVWDALIGQGGANNTAGEAKIRQSSVVGRDAACFQRGLWHMACVAPDLRIYQPVWMFATEGHGDLLTGLGLHAQHTGGGIGSNMWGCDGVG